MADANALAAPAVNPPAPNPQPQAPQQNALALPGSSSQAAPVQQQQQQQIPAPSHQQTVAALRHFGAIERELMTLLADPDVGKADVRSKVIDGVTSLVSEGISAPADAVRELATFPDKPFDQKQWLEQKFTQIVQAQTAVLQHHQYGVQQNPSLAQEQPYDPDDHQAIMSGLVSQYQQGQKNG